MTAASAPDPSAAPAAPAALASIASLEAVWRERRSVRGFLPAPIPHADLARVFSAAQHAPSWCNTQPWRVAVTEPPATAALAEALQAAARARLPAPEVAFPGEYPSPYRERRVACGAALYQALGVARGDQAGRYAAWLRNYAFFGAPHVAIVACDRRLGPYAYVDLGVWLGYVLTAATAAGIATCAMASVAAYPDVLRAHLPIADGETVVFGLALGRLDPEAPANACRTTREDVSANVAFVTALTGAPAAP